MLSCFEFLRRIGYMADSAIRRGTRPALQLVRRSSDVIGYFRRDTSDFYIRGTEKD